MKHYGSRLNPLNIFVDGAWMGNYESVNRRNIGVTRIPGIQSTTTLRTEAQRTQRRAASITASSTTASR